MAKSASCVLLSRETSSYAIINNTRMVKQAVCKYYRRKRGGAQLNCYHVRRTRDERGKETRRKEEKKKRGFRIT